MGACGVSICKTEAELAELVTELGVSSLSTFFGCCCSSEVKLGELVARRVRPGATHSRDE
jgi:hypothetical protein